MSEKQDEGAGWAVAGLLSVVPIAILRAWVATVLWGWSVVPLGGPALSLAVAVPALCLLLCLLSMGADFSKKSERSMADAIALAVVWPLLLLGTAWLGRAIVL